jgi:hypothetical protein
MFFKSRITVIATVTSLAAFTACSAGPSQSVPAIQASNVQIQTLPSGEHVVRAGSHVIRFGGSLHRAAMGRGWIEPARRHHKRTLLYGASYDGGYINIYKENGSNQSPIGQLTSGLTSPQGVVVDKSHQLWVANTNAFNVVAFKRGATTPFATLSDPGYYPIAVAVDSNGTVYAANAQGTSGQTGNVTYWKQGSSSPSGTLTYSTFQLVLGIGVDASNNVYVTFIPKSGPPEVAEFPAGSQNGEVLSLSDTTISDITFDKSADLVMEDGSGGLGVWAPPYSGPPSRTLNIFGNEPTLNRTQSEVWIAYANFSHPMIEGYSYSDGTLLDTITTGWVPQHAVPYGVAVDPAARP